MVVVPVRVDREVDVLAADRANRRKVARHELRELRVDRQHTVRADRYGDVAAEPEQHVEVVADLLGADLGRRELLGGYLCKARGAAESRRCQADREHTRRHVHSSLDVLRVLPAG